ncbi:MAG: hypothetical protein A2287_05010 [Candidatus Melainabacteria bacterium RIFOXYA12_FULL_32_12]|nr:MAG: hypothetical protein A2255_00145 [Candidatus Melainabacteria bacterium RIFOXYA2_FULL_32_9]OGI29944.1 MAG: hypothetical protein A2287_05010 [Candidatus Melainabacteria bacterium RIFOXYA12_FULL_32_12]
MKKVLVSLILAFILNSGQQVFAVNWVHVGTSESGNVNYLDLDSVEHDGDYAYSWYKVIIKDPDNELKQNGADSIKAKLVFNCSNRTYKLIKSISYDSQGRVILEAEDTEGFESITPNTTPERIFNRICTNQENTS